jgi:tRNA-dihydrouridine synthase A
MLDAVDGVMLGRAAYQRPALLAEVDRRFAGAAAPRSDGTAAAPGSDGTAAAPAPDPDDLIGVAAAMIPYVAEVVAGGVRPHAVTRHMLGLFYGRPGARAWRRHLTVAAVRPGATEAVLEEALAAIAARRRDVRPVPATHQIDAA